MVADMVADLEVDMVADKERGKSGAEWWHIPRWDEDSSLRRANMERGQHKTNFLIVNMLCVHCSLQKKKLLKGISILLK